MQFSLSGFSFNNLFNLFKTKEVVSLSSEGKSISVETALNSRCSSDNDGNPKKFHWGLFDSSKKLSEEHISSIVKAANIPRFTNKGVFIRIEQNLLTFIIDGNIKGIEREWAMIESGMQLQAVLLICSALGVGAQIHNMGKNGSPINKEEYGIIQVELKPMKPTFNGSYWSKSLPSGENAWRSGNLPNPDRDGMKPLMSLISTLKTSSKGSTKTTEKTMSQLLWAARGRTPHYYMSKTWGLTIPTWAGEQGITSLYLISKGGTFRYINWEDDHPTHAIGKLNDNSINDLRNKLNIRQIPSYCIVLEKNEESGRALWEIGYQLENLLLQATSLEVSYKTMLLNEHQRSTILELGLKGASALFFI